MDTACGKAIMDIVTKETGIMMQDTEKANVYTRMDLLIVENFV